MSDTNENIAFENATLIYNGKELEEHVEDVLCGIDKARFLLNDLLDYIYRPNDRKICCLYGLKMTGKNIMMLQSIKALNDYNNCLLIDCGKDVSVFQLRKIIESYPACKYIFIDEITKAENFIDTSSVLANKYAAEGKKVIAMGTDSFGFFLAKQDELFDRANIIHTTYISYAEYHHICGKSISDYIKYGGTLSRENVFYNRGTTNEYSNSAIAYNIMHSLEKWHQGRNSGILEEYIERGDLPSLVNKVIEYNNRTFLADVMNRDFVSHDRIRVALNIKEDTLKVDKGVVRVIIEYLKALDVLAEMPVINSTRHDHIFIQTGMRYSQASDMAKALITSENFNDYNQNEKRIILDKIEQSICGGILEDIILYQTAGSVSKSFELDTGLFQDIVVSKYQRYEPSKEFDVVIMNYPKKKAAIIEVKHSDKIDTHQSRHLRDEEFCKLFEEDTGTKIINKVVIYRGESKLTSCNNEDITYLNAEKYLRNLDDYICALTTQPFTEQMLHDERDYS